MTAKTAAMSLSVRQLSLRLPDKAQTSLVSDLTFDVAPGEVLALMGPSGSGKSSVLNWITGIVSADIDAEGEAWLGDRIISTLPAEQRRLGLMLQQDYLFPHMSVAENLLFGLRSSGTFGVTRSARWQRVSDSLSEAGLVGLEHRDPATLSGGQRARVSLLRTLLSAPYALLLDEPFSRLDVAMREQIRTFTWHYAAQLPVLLVTHDLSDVPSGARVLRIGEDFTSV